MGKLCKREGEAPAEPELSNDDDSSTRLGGSLSLPENASFE